MINFFKNIILFIITVFIISIISEIFIRFAHIASVSSTEFYEDIGRGRRRSLDFLYFNEGFGIGSFNKYRYIGRAYPPKKNSKTIRIALMGDSFVESFQVFRRDYFGVIAESILNKNNSEKKFEFLNFGRSGFDMADIYAYQKNLVEKFNPDYIFYFISNDDLYPKYSDPLRPKTILKNDSLIISFDFSIYEINKFKMSKFYTQNSTILNMLNNCRKKIKRIPILAILFDKIYFWFHSNKKKKKIIRDYKELDLVTEKIVQSLNPHKVIFINRGTNTFKSEFLDLIKKRRFLYLDLNKPLENLRLKGINPTYWSVTNKYGHWNQQAHRTIALYLSKNIENLVN